jgi:hypothetical protein
VDCGPGAQLGEGGSSLACCLPCELIE